jgi:hypothetical protein
MFIEPCIQVKAVIDPPAPESDVGHLELCQQGHPDAEVRRCLLLGEAAHRGEWQVYLVHEEPHDCQASDPGA